MTLDADARALLDGPHPCSLTTLDADGAPYAIVIWCGRAGDRITVNAGTPSRWLDHLRADPRVALTVVDRDDMLHYLHARGRVVEIRQDEGFAHMDALARVYDGTEEFVWEDPAHTRRWVVTIEPEQLRVHRFEQPQGQRRP
jgi:PPOX class probable F420-dependent enzyme